MRFTTNQYAKRHPNVDDFLPEFLDSYIEPMTRVLMREELMDSGCVNIKRELSSDGFQHIFSAEVVALSPGSVEELRGLLARVMPYIQAGIGSHGLSSQIEEFIKREL